MSEQESAYRRGFVHGANRCWEQIMRCERLGYKRPKEISNCIAIWVDDLDEWRFSYTEYCPPEPHYIHSWEKAKMLCFLANEIGYGENECAYCGSKENLSIDHIVSVADGGTPHLKNLQVLCCSCNSSKGAKSEEVAE